MGPENSNYRNLNENPCSMCMPMGAILPFKGIEEAMVVLHGSQGCSTYMRRHIAEHFNEPVDVGSSALNEKGTVYGGEGNLKKALDNIIKVYQPKLIGVLTTCLAETIGEDIRRITTDYLAERGLEDLAIVPAATPGYGGNHPEGYFLAVRSIVETLTGETGTHAKVNIIIPNISPADVRELKRILQLMEVDYVLLPDISDTLDRPYEKPYTKIAKGGTKIADIKAMGGAAATIQMGITMADELSPGKYLAERFGVPLFNLPIPIGVDNTDLFINTLSNITGKPCPDGLKHERGRLLDAMIDSHKYNFQGRSVVFGEPELVYAVAKTCFENGIFPLVVASGSKNDRLGKLLEREIELAPEKPVILNEADFTQIREKSKAAGVNVAIGHSDGRYLTEKEGIPLVRLGFPIHDRVGGQRLLSVGYTGTAMLLDRITNTLLENKYKTYRSVMKEKYFRDSKQRIAGAK
ncbi:nitrogenase molybdenum-iron protein NifN [Dendrosporobacter quercicolus]|uniref:Nitrogenase molybdenum-iron protein NifN n=1 Tax=Dendrosporobacter quercicolus TaxID=146817 RepID=A0A1G9U9D0_9FIRM|nr:nitrogenase component 1 [Dendrosporobacter quercicolus]SDM56606.1 nitrogenase molybdenum-iron protein NifN [Dendrosporobacter quercicolus]